jgi:molybdopterin-containing oxidoreductase family iron-sulfur binding subunit
MGTHFARVITREVGTYPRAKITYLPVLCNHCENAPCARVCPTGATHIRSDGIVMVDHDLCIGCRACAVACPYMNRHYVGPAALQQTNGSSSLSPFDLVKFAQFEEGTNTKCMFCQHRLAQGLQPACVVTCPTECRIFGDLDDEDGQLQRLIRERGGQPLLPECNTKPSVYYIE